MNHLECEITSEEFSGLVVAVHKTTEFGIVNENDDFGMSSSISGSGGIGTSSLPFDFTNHIKLIHEIYQSNHLIIFNSLRQCFA